MGFCHAKPITVFFVLLLIVYSNVNSYVPSYITPTGSPIPYSIASRLFSLGANFPKFPEWPRNLGKFMLGCFYRSIVGCKILLLIDE